jgi:hypothetical protein
LVEETFRCENCGKTVKVSDGKVPSCCGKPMTKLPLDVCLQPAHAEHARPMESEEPCDEGRAGV